MKKTLAIVTDYDTKERKVMATPLTQAEARRIIKAYRSDNIQCRIEFITPPSEPEYR